MKDSSIEKILSTMISDQVTPGVIYFAWSDGEVLLEHVTGSTRYTEEGSVALQRDFLFDIASLTKIITATGVLIAIDKGLLVLSDKIRSFIPECSFGEHVTVWHLLTHTAGIGVKMSTIEQPTSGVCIPDEILNAEMLFEPGSRVMFTNVNSYLLGKVLERVSGVGLDKYLHKELFAPLGMSHTLFNPPPHLRSHIPPTEITSERGLIWGSVHDESAYRLGGVVGHAGLFSTVDDLHAFCSLWLNTGMYGGTRILSEEIIAVATRNQVPDLELATGLGWMLDRPWMAEFVGRAYAHHAFTGPSLMICPEKNTSIITMMNATYPLRAGADRHLYQQKLNHELYTLLYLK